MRVAPLGSMSPKSRGRRPKRPSGRKTRAGRNDAPDVERILGDVVHDAGRDLCKITDPLEAELAVSSLVGTWSGNFPAEDDPEVVFGEGLIKIAERLGTAEAQALLRGLAALGTDRQRTRAATAAAELAARGVAEPAWAGQLGGVELTGSWSYSDVYGDQTSVLLAFERAGNAHGLVVLVDHTLGDIATDAFVVSDAPEVLRLIRDEDSLVTVREITPAQARGLAEAGIAATDRTGDPPVDEDYRPHRALALARLRTLPAGAVPVPPEDVPPARRRDIVADFLSSSEGAALPDQGLRCTTLIVEHGCDVDGGRPLRVSPVKTELFLLDWLPRTADLDEAEQAAMPEVMRAWVRWAGADLPVEAREALDEAAADFGDRFPLAYAGWDGPDIAELLLADVAESSLGPDELEDVLERRIFTMPFTGTRIGDEDFSELDPGDEDERRLLITGEHPEYHDVLSDPMSEELVDGANPRLHVAMHEIVANQLWHDDPPEAWEAAQRLTAAGMERHDVLHAIAEALSRHIYRTMTESGPTDNDAYRRDLDALGQDP